MDWRRVQSGVNANREPIRLPVVAVSDSWEDWDHLASEEAFAEALEQQAEAYRELPEWIQYKPRIGDAYGDV